MSAHLAPPRGGQAAFAQSLDHAWARAPREVMAALGVDPALGLTAAQAQERLASHGPNQLRAIAPRSI